MRFERGKDPRHSMDIGLKATAPIVYRLLVEDHSYENSFGTSNPEKNSYAIGISDVRTKEILRNIQYHPQGVHNYYVEFMDKEGRIFSGISPLSHYAGQAIQYRGEVFLIPEV